MINPLTVVVLLEAVAKSLAAVVPTYVGRQQPDKMSVVSGAGKIRLTPNCSSLAMSAMSLASFTHP